MQLIQDKVIKNQSLFKHRGGVFTLTFAQIIRNLWISGEISIFPDTFYNTFTDVIPHFLGYTQQDAAQFLIYCLQILHNELNVSIAARLMNKLDDQQKLYSNPNKKQDVWKKYQLQNQSIICKLFTGMVSSIISCSSCKHQETKYQFFNIFPVELPGNQEYRVRFVPLSKYFDEADYKPRTFQIQIKDNEYLDKKTVLKKSIQVLKLDYKKVVFKQNLFQVYQEINLKQAFLYQFDDEKGLKYDSSTIVIFGHPRFQEDPSKIIRMKFLISSYYSMSYKQYIIYPIQKDRTIKNVRTTINQYLQKRGDAKNVKVGQRGGDSGQSQRLYERMYNTSLINQLSAISIDLKVFDNIPTDPKTKASYKCQVCSQVHKRYRDCLIPSQFDDTLLIDFSSLITIRVLILVAQLSYKTSYEATTKLKQTKDLDNPNIISQQTHLQDCIKRGLQPQKLENFKCSNCGQTNKQTKQIVIEYLPDVLIIQLNRFLVRKNQNFFKTTKNNILVHFNEKNPLDMNVFVRGGLKRQQIPFEYDEQKKQKFYPHRGPVSRAQLRKSAINTSSVRYQKVDKNYSKNEYDLEGVVYHHGSSNSGHYYCKRKQINMYNEKVWYQFNDAKAEEILNYRMLYGQKKQQLPQDEAYLLFYHRRMGK